ncbi:MAG: NACHT domain-containing protein [Snowella sp.]|nr:MAG: NACHT domain-containing protein [Snowella sp.]
MLTGAEALIVDALAKGLIGQLVKSGWEGIAKSELLQTNVGDLWRDGKYLFVREYAQRYWDRHGSVRVLKMTKPMNLESIYINMQCLNKFTRDKYESSLNLEKAFRESNQRRYRSQKDGKQEGMVFANQEKYLMVFGEPGIGKSTFLRKVGLEAMKGNNEKYQPNLTPVLLELKHFKEEQIDIQALIQKEFEICGFPNVEKAIPDKLKKGELLILLDGLDEVPDANTNNVITTIQNFVDQHNKNRFIISCRTAARTHFRQFTDIEIVEFDDQQIETFIEHWFRDEPETAKECWELLQQPEYASAKELGQTPLLLTFLCLVYDENQAFPTNRSRLYGDALRILLERWAAENRLPNRRQIYENLSIENEEILLSEIAYFYFSEDRLFYNQGELTDQIKTFLMDSLNAPHYLDGEQILKTIEKEQGIFVERARGEYSFSHLTLQEYLTAKYIVDNNLVGQVVKAHLTEPRWREVFLLIAGLILGKQQTSDFFGVMAQMAKDFLQTQLGEKFLPVLRWADRMTKDSVNSPIKPPGRRVIAYAYAYANVYAIAYANAIVNAIAYTYAYTITNTNAIAIVYAYAYALDIANANAISITIDIAIDYTKFLTSLITLAELFQQDQIFSTVNDQFLITKLREEQDFFNTKPQLKWKEFEERIKVIFQIWNQTFSLIPDLLNFGFEEIKDIDQQYFYIYHLMLDCQKIAPNLAPGVWAEIEDGMLLP